MNFKIDKNIYIKYMNNYINNKVLIYSSVMENIAMENENENEMEIEIADFSLNDYTQYNPNDSIEEMFHYEVEKAIDNGDIKLINNAIKEYGHLLNSSYISWANNISLQIVEEQIEDMVI